MISRTHCSSLVNRGLWWAMFILQFEEPRCTVQCRLFSANTCLAGWGWVSDLETDHFSCCCCCCCCCCCYNNPHHSLTCHCLFGICEKDQQKWPSQISALQLGDGLLSSSPFLSTIVSSLWEWICQLFWLGSCFCLDWTTTITTTTTLGRFAW